MEAIKTRRVYEPYDKNDRYRILVDKLWPRGLTKEKAKVDLWLKEIAPSDDLRKWFSHDPAKWEEFQNKYQKELELKPEFVQTIKQIEKKTGKVTLLYSARNTKNNNAVALKAFLEKE